MVLPNQEMNSAFDGDGLLAGFGDLLDSAFADFDKAAAGHLQAIEAGQDEELRRRYPDLTLEWWHQLRLLGEGKITKEEFLRWLLGVQPPEGQN